MHVKVRNALLARGGPRETGFVRDSYRPFDNRWLYWESDRRLLTAPAPDYWPHVFPGNLWLVFRSAFTQRRLGTTGMCRQKRRLIPPESSVVAYAMFPAWLRYYDGVVAAGTACEPHPNLSGAAENYLERLAAGVEDLFHYVIATLHDPAYRNANAGALRMGWPRIPLPGWPDGDAAGAAEALG